MIVHPTFAKVRFEQSIRALLEQPSNYAQAGVRLISYDFPVLIVELYWYTQDRWLRLRVDATDYDYRPLQGWWVDENDIALVGGSRRVPVGMGFQTGAPPSGERRCWFCFMGWRDWHDHSGHQDTAWAAIRGHSEFSPLALLLQLISNLRHPGVNVT